MRNIFFCCSLTLVAAVPALADQGCVETSTTTVTATVCTQFDCVQELNGSCAMWACSKTQTAKYVDANSSGCSRVANCGKKALFSAGPADEPQTDSTQECDWYPCVQADPATQVCLAYLCVSKRVFETVSVTYRNAKCVPVPSGLMQLPKQPQPRREETIKPSPAPMNNVKKSPPPLP